MHRGERSGRTIHVAPSLSLSGSADTCNLISMLVETPGHTQARMRGGKESGLIGATRASL